VNGHHRVQNKWEFSQLREAGPLILSREGDRDLTLSQGPRYGWLNRQDLAQRKLLCMFGWEDAITVEDDIDDIGRVLLTLHPDLSPSSSSLTFPFSSRSGTGVLRDLWRLMH
jgi:hypothetical protein